MIRFASLLLGVSLALAAPLARAQAPQPPEIAARGYLLVDMTANQVLAERNADTPAEPASLTKLMTAYLVFQAIKDRKLTLEQTLPVSERAWAERKYGGSLMFIDPKMTPTVDELLKGMIVQSGNDASVALAEGVGGTVENFVALMNRQAQAWGLKATSFRNPTGLTEAGHRSTARELAFIAQRIIRDFPERYAYYAMPEWTFNRIRQDNRNLLLRRDPTVDGMKTGYTEAAGYCLISSAQRDFPNGKRRLLSVVMGADSMQARANESQKLLNWGYTAYDAVRLFEAGKPVATVPVWKGSAPEARLGAEGALFVAVPRGEGERLQTKIERTDPLVAPLAKGQRVGTLKVSTASGTAVATVPLVVQEEVPQAGFLGRAWDALRLWIK
ncbi:D-alanyl-D-alanine carboxypeptidase family protein [Ideonella livida]|uniref:serine-type D-Ala-D-Ala carboxypeptidase n=1 Tax=Ideonella livida TaxID=2707176 RepID=A0A7C9PJM6_9BURK|nr:D-alanyl-D-alanine carboxypeptidase family protein [Ideonella livida]NDY92654.1 D-alanyl-D-alanine carboxypeptidase [Ideonella livida]